MIRLLLILYKRLFCACLGYVHWHNLVHKYKLEDDCAVILIPSPVDEECTLYAVRYLKAFFEHNKFTHAIFLSDYQQLPEMMKQYEVKEKECRIISFNKKKCEHLIDFHNANLNDSRLIIASLNIPSGRNGLDYLRTNVLTKEEIFLMGIYNIMEGSEFEQRSNTKNVSRIK